VRTAYCLAHRVLCDSPLLLFQYQSYSAADVDQFLGTYLYCDWVHECSWAEKVRPSSLENRCQSFKSSVGLWQAERVGGGAGQCHHSAHAVGVLGPSEPYPTRFSG
jgi:hypothetical protein